jgi:hypothetical protein
MNFAVISCVGDERISCISAKYIIRLSQAQPPPYPSDVATRPAVTGGPPQGKRRNRPNSGASSSSSAVPLSSRHARQQQQPAQHFTELEVMSNNKHGQRRGGRKNTHQV